jgi:hypothetical protein
MLWHGANEDVLLSMSLRLNMVHCAWLMLTPALCSQGQDSQFTFDPNGNLATESAAIVAPPQILSHPQPQVVGPGELASFIVVVADTRALTYEWRFNSTNTVSSATNDTLLLQNVAATNEGEYRVVLTNPSGSVTSAPAALMIDGDHDGLADSWELANFGNLNQKPSDDFDGDDVSNFDEFGDGTSPTNSASARYRLSIQANGGLIEAVPSELSYTNGEIVTLTATALAPEIFHGWTGDVIVRSNVISVTMTNNKTVVAHFQPLVLVWTSLAGGSWHQPTNWFPPVVPTMEDQVFITNSGPTITLNEPADCGRLTFGLASGSIPTISGTGTLTIHTNGTWTDGYMSGSGRTIIAPGATLTINAPGSVNLNGRTLENGGTVRLTGTAGISLDGAVITNRPGGLFEVQATQPFSTLTLSGFGVCRFDNAGTFRKISSGATGVVGTSFNNYGVVEIPGGDLDLRGGGTHSGSFDVPAGRTLMLSGGTHTALASSTITGAGNLMTANNVTANLAGLINLAGTHTFNGTAANFTGNFICTNNTIAIGRGGANAANFSGTGTVTPAILTLSAGTLSGSNTVTVLNQMTWTGGGMSGSGRTIIPAGVTLTINSVGGVSLNTRTLDNEGTVVWTGAGSIALTSGVITNRPGALFQAQNAAFLSSGGGVSRFDNAGTFRKSAGGATTVSPAVSFNNYSVTEIPGGNLDLRGGGTNSGSFDVPAGRTLIFSGGSYTNGTGSSITGAGNLTMDNATVTLAGTVNLTGTITVDGGTANFSGINTVSPAVLIVNGGTLTGSSTVTALNQMTWSGGTMSGSGRTVVPTGITLSINNVNGVSLSGRTLDNGGTVLWTGGGAMSLGNAVITNRPGALFEAQSGASIALASGVNRIDNAGTFRKTASATTTIFGGISLNNYGTVELRRGILVANGGYNTVSNATLYCGIAGTIAGTGYGRLQVAGAVTLNGALAVDLLNSFLPATNDNFTILIAGTRNGAFANFLYPSNTVSMQVSNTPTSVIARVTGFVVPVPQPILLSPLIMGPDIRLTWTAVSNITYRLEYNPDLLTTNWNALPGYITATSNLASTLDTLTSSSRYYRVRVNP